MAYVSADILTIGDELLIGQVVDSNSAFIASEFTQIGITVRRILSVPDKVADIISTLDESIKNTDITVLTGGLGPTDDDITKETLNRYFGGTLVLHTPALQNIESISKSRGFKMTVRNQRQAFVPDNCQVLRNSNGTAPGMLFRKNGKMIISLPGVPFEMMAILRQEVIPVIRSSYDLPVKLQKSVLTTGLSESATADLLNEWENSLPEGYGLAYLPSIGILRIRLSISADNNDKLKYQFKEKVDQLVNLIGKDHVFGFDNDTLAQVVGDRLRELHNTLSVAESCTGGYIAHLITSVPGSSAYFTGSVTTYADNAKIRLLDVSGEDIMDEGAVSKKVVEKMAVGSRLLFGTDFAIATSGIAGPAGGTETKPVGTVWIAVASPVRVISQRFLFGDNRERNIIRASLTSLNMLRILLTCPDEK
jgi:nicotinamide-nucleotide amidase